MTRETKAATKTQIKEAHVGGVRTAAGETTQPGCDPSAGQPPASGWIGIKAREGPALVPEKLREELKRRGFELDAVIPGWLEMGALVTRDSQRPKYLIPRRLGGPLVKLIIFRAEVIDPEGDDEQ
jgi:hypothetical protein